MSKKTQSFKLDDEAIKRKREHLRREQITLDSTKIAYDIQKRQVELDLPRRQAQEQLIAMKNQLELSEKNVKVLTKQIREKKIVQGLPSQ